MKINQATISEINERVEIEEVVGDFVSLKRKGRYLWACCPFHGEKTASFSVTPAKGIYKCFGCGAAGDAIQFVMDLEGYSYVETMKYLAKKYGIEIQEEEQTDEQVQKQNEKDSLFIALNFADKYFREVLWNHPEGKAIGLSYFKERGIPENAIHKFGLGYSLEAWDGLIRAATENGHSLEILEKSGLIISKEDKRYDRFRGRVIFPIHNVTGKVIAFGARQLKTDKKQPKYINSPETDVYHKGKIVYGIYQAKQAIRQEENCYLVEGYTDVIALHLAGVENVVSSSGTSLTEDQIKLIGRYSENITVLFDGDAAGVRASLRGIDMILEGGLNVKAVVFPEGEDPDSYAQKLGTAGFKAYLDEQAKDFITFKTELYAREAANDPVRKADTIREIVASVAKIPDAMKRAVYVKQCSNLLEMDEAVLIAELNKIRIRKNKDKPKDEPSSSRLEAIEHPVAEQPPDLDRIISLQERESIRLLIIYGHNKMEEEHHLYDHLLGELDDIEFKTPVYKRMLEIFKGELAKGRVVDSDFFIHHTDSEIKREVIDLISEKYDISTHWGDKYSIYVPREPEILNSVVFTNILRLKFRTVQKLVTGNMAELKKATTPEEQDRLINIQIALKQTEMEIARHLGNVVSG